jgi:TolB-like protein
MKKFNLLFVAILVGLITTGCVTHTRIKKLPTMSEATYFSSKELVARASDVNRAKIVAVTSLADVNNLKQSSDFGRLYSDSMITHFIKAGWKVIDYRGRNIIASVKEGEFYLNRDEIKSLPENSLIFVGTYGKYQDGLVLNLRLLDANDNQVVSVSDVHLIDPESINLSYKSNCKDLACYNKSILKREDTREEKFKINIVDADCVDNKKAQK